MRSIVVVFALVSGLAGCPPASLPPRPPEPPGPALDDPATLTEVAAGTRIKVLSMSNGFDDSVEVDDVCVVVELTRESTTDDWVGTLTCGDDDYEIDDFNQLDFSFVR
ncbi:MAG: hypothetical protein U1F43_03110 [Myxococcota bacterium]